MRYRTCTSPPPAFGGKDCSTLGPDEEVEVCKLRDCPGNNCCVFLFKGVFLRYIVSIENDSQPKKSDEG